MWTEFKPALRFVLWFVGLYFIGNILYGLYIASFGNTPDYLTVLAAKQTAWILNGVGYQVDAVSNMKRPTVFLKSGETTVLNVYEGCNGFNVFIVFAAFLVAFGGPRKRYFWFLPLGILVLYLSNLVRITLLYWTAISHHRYFYYVHKYIFTAIIYAVVFILWILWVNKLNDRKKNVVDE